ncbi:protein FAM184A-like isoform X2 [Tribolium madens]|uniref:protein FAM184A-like isoform X2 n=1 Tax=Tribolium madens TaxID=41895 RepID=UPI001CF73C3B|nr:protein FAM184A-like isoform X2 [Tribolium madens]
MSDTDDTDELLLIPPDFFTSNPALNPDSLGPYYRVVDGLITQVNHLENRLSFIESSSEFSLSLISDSPEMYSPSRFRKFMGEDGGKTTSTQSTPQKPRTKFTLNSLPNSPDIEHLKKTALNKAKKSECNPMLGEIDNFLSNVKFIKRLNTVRNLESDFNSVDGVAKNLDMGQVNEMLREIELQEKNEKPCVKEKVWQTGDNVGAVPDYGLGMRNNMYTEGRKTFPGGDSITERNESESSDSTQATAFEKFKYDCNLGLVSLSKLWNSNDVRDLPSKFQQKLQEERLRRQNCRLKRRRRCCSYMKHCEQAIQELQNRVLELQERVAVAIQVDEAKDKAILRFHESWEKAGVKLQDIEKQKEKLEEEVDKLRRKLNEDSDETNQKITHYEKEASLALNIAHSTQDKLVVLEKRCQQLENELKTAEINSEEFQQKYLQEMEKNKHYPEILASKDLELNDCKSVLAEARKEITQSKKAIETCQSELSSMKNENESLHSKLNTEKENNKRLTEQKNKLLEEITAHKSITDELSKSREQLETNKLELKNFYQGQVELVVQSKLKEFQKQLDDAEKALKEELSRKELSIAKTAASHIQQISDKHSLEVKLIEEKHQEECRLYQLQITQLRHELDESNLKIKRQHEKHVHIERQLHKFMESLRQDHVTTLDEMNSFRSKSLEEILSFNMAEEEEKMGETPVSSRPEKGTRRKDGIQETIQMLLDRKGQGDEGYNVTKEKMRDMKGKPPWK